MDNKKLTDSLIRTNQVILCNGLFNGPRLTPTGKISHAKTRVYTQRYRKEWEYMPDFKGWLTSVPGQATRAYCTFCKKNLHAHRLSLLKHTCTMKHQRAALMHQNEMNAKHATAVKIAEIEAGYVEEVDRGEMIQKESNREVEEDNEDYEYVVETLEMEDDELEDSQCKEQEQGDGEAEEEEEVEEEEEEEEGNMHGSMDEDDPSPINKKIKLETQDDECRDTLAEAMAHVHGEYLDGTDEQGDVQLEMVVGEHEVIHEEDHDTSMNSNEEDVSESPNKNIEEIKCDVSGEKSSAEADSSEMGSESEISPEQSINEIGIAYKSLNVVLNEAKVGVTSSQSSFGNSLSLPSGQTKTFKLNTGKTVTLRRGTQYVLSNIKANNIPGLVWTDQKNGVQSEVSTKSGQLTISGTQKINPYAAVPGTSQESLSQKSTSKSGSSKKSCISTQVMDTSKGLPIGGLQVSLYKLMDGRWTFLNESYTSPSGRCNDLVDNSKCNFTAGRYKMHFDVDKYFTLRRIETMYPFIEIVFDVKNPTGNYHIPVLLSPFGYTTYRGSDR